MNGAGLMTRAIAVALLVRRRQSSPSSEEAEVRSRSPGSARSVAMPRRLDAESGDSVCRSVGARRTPPHADVRDACDVTSLSCAPCAHDKEGPGRLLRQSLPGPMYAADTWCP